MRRRAESLVELLARAQTGLDHEQAHPEQAWGIGALIRVAVVNFGEPVLPMEKDGFEGGAKLAREARFLFRECFVPVESIVTRRPWPVQKGSAAQLKHPQQGRRKIHSELLFYKPY